MNRLCWPAILVIVTFLALAASCRYAPAPDRSSTLLLKLYLVEDQEGLDVQPYAVLIGDGLLLASKDVVWSISGIQESGFVFLESSKSGFQTGFRYDHPYYVYQAWPMPTNDEPNFLGVVDAPVWAGPKIETQLLDAAESLDVQFTIQFYSPMHSEITSKTLNWTVVGTDVNLKPQRLE